MTPEKLGRVIKRNTSVRQGTLVVVDRERGHLGVGVSHAQALFGVIHSRYVLMLVSLAMIILWRKHGQNSRANSV